MLSKYDKTQIKVLKSALIDFYNAEALAIAKQCLLSDMSKHETSNKLPHVPVQRDGDKRIGREVDDIFTLIIYLDEHKLLNCLPMYVTDGLDSRPSTRLYEGDLKILMSCLARMDERMVAIESTLTSIIQNVHALQPKSMRRPPTSATYQSTPRRPVNNSVFNQPQPLPPVIPEETAVKSGISSVSLPAESTSTRTSTDVNAALVQTSETTTDWATRVAITNQFEALADDDHSQSCSQRETEHPFTEYVSNRIRRKRSRQPSPQQNTERIVNVQLSEIPYEVHSATCRAPLIFG